MEYRKVNWKYILEEDYRINLPKKLRMEAVSVDYISIYYRPDNKAHILCIYKDYAWDGPSGPTYDTDGTIKASAAHDAFYQLMRLGHVSIKKRKAVDKLYLKMMKGFGVTFPKRWAHYIGVRLGAKRAARP